MVLEDNKTIADTESAYKYIYLVLSIPSYMTTKELENTKGQEESVEEHSVMSVEVCKCSIILQVLKITSCNLLNRHNCW